MLAFCSVLGGVGPLAAPAHALQAGCTYLQEQHPLLVTNFLEDFASDMSRATGTPVSPAQIDLRFAVVVPSYNYSVAFVASPDPTRFPYAVYTAQADSDSGVFYTGREAAFPVAHPHRLARTLGNPYFGTLLGECWERAYRLSVPSSYVALGDSYSSGEGVPAFQAGTDTAGPPENRCHRSYGAYPRLLEEMAGLRPTLHWACSGALIANLSTGQWNEGRQFDRLTSATTVVTVSIGGNDAGFASVLNDCIYPVAAIPGQGLPGCRFRRDGSLRRQIASLEHSRDAGCVLVVFCYPETRSLHATYKEIARRAPNARILVVGYPHLFPARPADTCQVGTLFGTALLVGKGDMEWMNNMSDLLADTMAAEVRVARGRGVDVTFVDLRQSFSGHEACGPTPWINQVQIDYWQPWFFLPRARPWSFHPNEAGQRAYASAVARRF